MASLSEILDREFENARRNGAEIKRSVVNEAKHIEISNPHLSRLRNEKVPLTRDVADKILSAFSGYSDIETLRTELDEIINKQSHSYKGLSNSTFEDSGKYSMDKAEEMFEKLSNPESLLCVDYRDFPQATQFGAYPKLAEKAGEAIKNGLCFALFQPFGTPKELKAIKNKFDSVIEENLDKNFELSNRAEYLAKSYSYLLELAMKVREVYQTMKEDAGEHSSDRIVLYEAQNPNPSITAIGIQSRIFLANYFEGQRRYDKIFEWVAVEGDEHYFFERWDKSISVEALNAQFNPVTAFWKKYKKLPQGDLKDAYAEFGLKKILGKDIKEVKWESWSK